MSLTDMRCKNAEPKDKQYKLFDARGLYLLVATNGSKFWRYKYRYLGTEKTLSLGSYPEVSLKEARERHFVAHKLVSDGRDPSLEKQEVRRRQIANAQNTFEGVAYEWMEHNKELWSENHAKTVRRRLEQDVFPLIGHKPIRDISPRQLLEVIKSIEKRSAYEMARRALQMSGQVFRYAIIHDRAERDPSQDLKGALRPYKKSHYAAMDFRELPNFLDKFDRNDARVLPPAFNEKEKKSVIKSGDVLLNIVGASIGRTAVADERIDGANCNQAVAIIRLSGEISPYYACKYLLSSFAQNIIHSEKVDVARANFNLNQIAELAVALPGRDEQEEIIQRIDKVFSQIDTFEALCEAELKRSATLRQSILKSAFSGKLVAQDPADEPASELLVRIKSGDSPKTKAKATTSRRGRKPRSDKSEAA